MEFPSSSKHDKVIVLSVSADKTCSITTVPSTNNGKHLRCDGMFLHVVSVAGSFLFYVFLSLLAVMIVLIVLFLW